MVKKSIKELKREYRHSRIRKKVFGATETPRLCVHRSLKNFYVQIINDETGKVLFGMSTKTKEVQSKLKTGGNIAAAAALGEAFAVQAVKKGFKKVCFDRGGYLFHGRVKAFADAARKAGMEF